MRGDVDLSRLRRHPRDWQPDGIDWLANGSPVWPNPKNIALFDDVGMGKTYMCVNAAQILFERKEISAAVVVAPARVRGEWDDPVEGMIHKDMYIDYSICRIDAKHPAVCKPRGDYLQWFIVSYPFLRSVHNADVLLKSLIGRQYWLFMDESSHVKNPQSHQSKGVRKIADFAYRRTTINGSPVTNNVMDLWNQMRLLDPKSVQNMNYYQFRNRFAKMGGYMGKNIVGVKDGDEMREMIRPWVLRRERRKTPGVDPKTYVTIPVEMPAHLFEMYYSMRKDMIAWLGSEIATASHAGVKMMRLAQLTAGFLGGIKDTECQTCSYPEEDHGITEEACLEFSGRKVPPRDVDDTKMQAVLQWIEDNPTKRAVIWCRFTAEIERLYEAMTKKGYRSSLLYGGVSGREADLALNDFKAGRTSYLIGQPQAGSEGLNLQLREGGGGADVAIYLSNDYNWKTRYQSEGRLRPTVENPCLYIDVVMTTPKGKKTTDHLTLERLRGKEELAKWTVATWTQKLTHLED